jgi:PAS domain S-box-containing protein
MTPQITLRAQAIRHAAALPTAALTAAVVSLSYYLTAVIGFGFALQPGSVSALWMPNSILLAGLLLTPKRWWWLVILAVLPAHLASELSSGVPMTMILSWFVSNVAQALFAAFCICKLVDDRLRFDRFRDLTIFILLGAFLAPFLSSFLDAALVKLNGWGNNSYWDIWRVRFFSNVIATLTLVPVVMLWVSGGIAALRKASPLRYLEGGLLFLGLLGVAIFVFDIQQDLIKKTSSHLYLPLPFLLWATVRFGPRGTSTSLLLVMFLAILGATRGAGPFVTSSSAHNALSIQLFLIVVSVPLMALAAVIEERQRVEALARHDQERLTLALNAAQMGTWDWQIPDNTLVWTEDTKRIFGLTDADSVDSFFRVVHPDDLPTVELAISHAIKDGVPYEIEFRFLKDGNIRWVLSKGNVLYDNSGQPLRMLGISVDLTDRKRAEQALAEINEQNQAILVHMRALAARLITAQESERRRISLLLHDDVSQNIAAIGLSISSLKRKLPASNEEIIAQLDRLGARTHDLTTQIRKLSHQLHPEVLEQLGLVAALESHVTEFGHKESIEIKFVADIGSDLLSFDLSVCLYRVALEALRNISRHSEARAASVSLKQENGYLMLEVSDSGRGFDVEKARRGSGIGLLSAEERIKLFQGTLDIRSDARTGTVLVARVPRKNPS